MVVAPTCVVFDTVAAELNAFSPSLSRGNLMSVASTSSTADAKKNAFSSSSSPPVALLEHLHVSLKPLLSLDIVPSELQADLAEFVKDDLKESSVDIPYDILLRVSRWGATPPARSSLKDAGLGACFQPSFLTNDQSSQSNRHTLRRPIRLHDALPPRRYRYVSQSPIRLIYPSSERPRSATRSSQGQTRRYRPDQRVIQYSGRWGGRMACFQNDWVVSWYGTSACSVPCTVLFLLAFP